MRRMFTEKQIEEMNKDMLSNGGIDIVAKTLTQKEVNWEKNIVLEPYDNTKTSVSTSYGKLLMINNILYIVLCGLVSNITETTQSTQVFATFVIEIPEEIGEKIIDENGKKLTETGTGHISSAYIRQYNATSYCNIDHYEKNKLKINYPYNGVTIPANTSIFFELRTFMILF